MIEYKFQATVKDGKIALYRKQYFNKYVASLEGQTVEVIVQKKKSTRTIAQNAYFHGVVCKYWADYVGCDIIAMKEILKAHFLTKEIEAKNGKVLKYVQPTHKLKLDEMRQFIDQCLILAVEYGIVIPSIDEVNL